MIRFLNEILEEEGYIFREPEGVDIVEEEEEETQKRDVQKHGVHNQKTHGGGGASVKGFETAAGRYTYSTNTANVVRKRAESLLKKGSGRKDRVTETALTLMKAAGSQRITTPLYRGMRIKGTVSDVAKKFRVGKTIDMALVSTSKSKDVAKQFASPAFARTRREGSVAVHVEFQGPKTGVSVAQFSYFKKEREVLVHGRFEVASARVSGNTIHVALKQQDVTFAKATSTVTYTPPDIEFESFNEMRSYRMHKHMAGKHNQKTHGKGKLGMTSTSGEFSDHADADSLQQALKQKHPGVKFDQLTENGISLDAAKEIANAYDEMADMFPDAAKRISFVSAAPNSFFAKGELSKRVDLPNGRTGIYMNALALAPGNREVLWKSRQQVKVAMVKAKDRVNTNEPRGAEDYPTERIAFVHEFGHHLQKNIVFNAQSNASLNIGYSKLQGMLSDKKVLRRISGRAVRDKEEAFSEGLVQMTHGSSQGTEYSRSLQKLLADNKAGGFTGKAPDYVMSPKGKGKKKGDDDDGDDATPSTMPKGDSPDPAPAKPKKTPDDTPDTATTPSTAPKKTLAQINAEMSAITSQHTLTTSDIARLGQLQRESNAITASPVVPSTGKKKPYEYETEPDVYMPGKAGKFIKADLHTTAGHNAAVTAKKSIQRELGDELASNPHWQKFRDEVLAKEYGTTNAGNLKPSEYLMHYDGKSYTAKPPGGGSPYVGVGQPPSHLQLASKRSPHADDDQFAGVFVQQWAGSSMDSHKHMVALQKVVNDKYGDGQWDIRTGPGSTARANSYSSKKSAADEAEELIAEHRQAYEAFADAMYNNTQRKFKQLGIKKMTLYRGQDSAISDSGEQMSAWSYGQGTIPDGTNFKARMQPMSSFSSAPSVAKKFGSFRMQTTVPVERIIASCKSGFGCLNEKEFVVIGTTTGMPVKRWANTPHKLDKTGAPKKLKMPKPPTPNAYGYVSWKKKDAYQAKLDAYNVQQAALLAPSTGSN